MTLGDVAAHVRLRDGGGLVSDGDWGKPKGLDSFAALRKQWFKRILEWGLVQRLQAHVHCKCKEPMLATLRNDVQAFLLTQGLSADNNITPGQPLALGPGVWRFVGFILVLSGKPMCIGCLSLGACLLVENYSMKTMESSCSHVRNITCQTSAMTHTREAFAFQGKV